MRKSLLAIAIAVGIGAYWLQYWLHANENAPTAADRSSNETAGRLEGDGKRLTAVALLSSRTHWNDDVDAVSGMLQIDATDLVVQAGPTMLEVSRSFETSTAWTGWLGDGWRLNWERRLVNAGSTVAIDEAGGNAYFSRSTADATYRSKSGERLTFKEGMATRHQADGGTETFDQVGRLVECRDRNANAINLRYDNAGHLSRIEGPRGSFLRFNTDSRGRLASVDASNGASVEYSYETAASPRSEERRGSICRYGYNDDGRITQIDDATVGRVEFQYDEQGRIVQRQNGTQQAEKYERDDAQHTVRHIDSTGQAITYHESSDGRRREAIDEAGRRSLQEFDEFGRLVKGTGPWGQTAEFGYDDSGRLSYVRNAARRTTHYKYVDGTRRVASTSAEGGPGETFEYDAQGNLLAVRRGDKAAFAGTYFPDGLVRTLREADGPVYEFTYDESGWMSTMAVAGRKTTYQHDVQGNLLRSIDPLGHASTWTYDDSGRVTGSTDSAGNTTRAQYDLLGRLLALTDPKGQVTRFAYDEDGRLNQLTDPAGGVTAYKYDNLGRVVTTERSDGGASSFEYDARGNVVHVVEDTGAGAEWKFEYDKAGNLTRESGPLGHERQYRYDDMDHVIEMRDALGRSEQYTYDPLGGLSSVRDPAGRVYQFERNAAGQLAAMTDPLDRRTLWNYDALGQLETVSQRGGAIWKRSATGSVSLGDQSNSPLFQVKRDAADNLDSYTAPGGEQRKFRSDGAGNVVAVVDPLGREWKLGYTTLGDLSAMTAPNGDRLGYSYVSAGQISAVADARNNHRSFEYDALGRIVRETDPLGRATAISYAPDGRLHSVATPDGQKIERRYDLLGRLTEIHNSDGTSQRFTYDAVGRLVAEENGDHKSEYSYDDLDRVIEVRQSPVGATLRYAYDKAGRRSELNVEGVGRWSYQYDERDRLTELREPSGNGTSFKYDEAQNTVTATLPNGVTVNRWHDAAGRVVSLSATASGNKLLVDRRYEYDAAGNLLRETHEGGTARAYEYDVLDRLTAVRKTDQTLAFKYDSAGNRLPNSGRAEYDAADQLVTYDDRSFEYDAQGRMIRGTKTGEPTLTYAYTDGGLLKTVKRGEHVVAEYAYDTSGRRVSKKAGGKTTHFLYDGSRLLAELDEQQHVVRTWTSAAWPLGPLGVREGDVSQYFVNDAAGSLLAAIGSSGELTASYDYTPFGEPSFGKVRPTSPAVIPGRFAGALFDSETGLYQFGARYYDPSLGRFLTPDPVLGILDVPASHNAYQYAYNNPLRFRDSSGATAAEIADSLSSAAGTAGRSAGSLFGYAWSRASAVPIRAWYAATGNTKGVGQLNRAVDRLTKNMGNGTGSAAWFAATIATDPLRFGSGLGTASVDYEQGNYGSALLHAGGDALRAIPLAATARATVLTMKGPGRIMTAQQDWNLIEKSKRIWGQTEGSVYAGSENNFLANLGVPAWLRNTRQARPNDTTIIFEGQAATWFQRHEVMGPLSLIKRLGGQRKAGFGDLELVKWHRNAAGEVVVTEAQLLSGKHAGGKLWDMFGPTERLWGRRGFELGADATIGGLVFHRQIFDALAAVGTNPAQLGDRFHRDRMIGSVARGETFAPPAIAKSARVPNVVGKPAADAKAEMVAAGYAPALASGDPAKSDAGQQPFAVQAQWPAPGTSLAAGKPVVLKIFTKPEGAPAETKQIAVPSLVGLKAAAARERLGGLKLGARFETTSEPAKSKDAEFTVSDQQPPANEMVDPGAAVVVRIFPRYQEPAANPVAENPPPKPPNDKKVPNLVGLTVRQAMDQAEAAGLSIRSYEDTGAATAPERSERVHTQVPAAGAPLPADGKVALKFNGTFKADAVVDKPPVVNPPSGDYLRRIKTTIVSYVADGKRTRPGDRLDEVHTIRWDYALLGPTVPLERELKRRQDELNQSNRDYQNVDFHKFLPTKEEIAKASAGSSSVRALNYIYFGGSISIPVSWKVEADDFIMPFDGTTKPPALPKDTRDVRTGAGPVW